MNDAMQGLIVGVTITYALYALWAVRVLRPMYANGSKCSKCNHSMRSLPHSSFHPRKAPPGGYGGRRLVPHLDVLVRMDVRTECALDPAHHRLRHLRRRNVLSVLCRYQVSSHHCCLGPSVFICIPTFIRISSCGKNTDVYIPRDLRSTCLVTFQTVTRDTSHPFSQGTISCVGAAFPLFSTGTCAAHHFHIVEFDLMHSICGWLRILECM